MKESNLKLGKEFLLEFLRKCHDIEYINTKIMGTLLIDDKDKELCIDSYLEQLNKINLSRTRYSEDKFQQYLNFAIKNNFGIYMNAKQRSTVFGIMSEFKCPLPADFIFLFNPKLDIDKNYFNKIFDNSKTLSRKKLVPWFKQICELRFQAVNNLLNETNSKFLSNLLSNDERCNNFAIKESTTNFSPF